MTELTLDKMQADVAEALELGVDDVPVDEHLGDLGLDSIALMRLLLAWEAIQPGLPQAQMYECETLADFAAVAQGTI